MIEMTKQDLEQIRGNVMKVGELLKKAMVEGFYTDYFDSLLSSRVSVIEALAHVNRRIDKLDTESAAAKKLKSAKKKKPAAKKKPVAKKRATKRAKPATKSVAKPVAKKHKPKKKPAPKKRARR